MTDRTKTLSAAPMWTPCTKRTATAPRGANPARCFWNTGKRKGNDEGKGGAGRDDCQPCAAEPLGGLIMFRVYREGFRSQAETFRHRDVAKGFADALRAAYPFSRIIVERAK